MTTDPPPTLDLPAPYHIGIVVRDIDAAIERYGTLFGVSEWRRRDIKPDEARPWHWHGKPQPAIGMKVAYSVTDAPFLEFIEPTTDVEWSATKHLREHGEGVFHVGYFADDIPALLERAEQLGIAAECHSDRVAYLDPDDAHGMRVELVASDMREALLHWIETDEWMLT